MANRRPTRCRVIGGRRQAAFDAGEIGQQRRPTRRDRMPARIFPTASACPLPISVVKRPPDGRSRCRSAADRAIRVRARRRRRRARRIWAVLPHLARQDGDSGVLDIRRDCRPPRRTFRSVSRSSFRRQIAPALPMPSRSALLRCRSGGARCAMSTPMPLAAGYWRAAPAAGTRCRCRDRGSGRRGSRSGKRASIASTTVSLSGRGSSVSADSRSLRPENSRRPTIRLSGSRASIRLAASPRA